MLLYIILITWLVIAPVMVGLLAVLEGENNLDTVHFVIGLIWPISIPLIMASIFFFKFAEFSRKITLVLINHICPPDTQQTR